MRIRVRKESGFILPLAVLLVLILTISGTSLMQHDFLERRTAMNAVDNHDGFYLANAGIERSRATFKVPDDFTWTTVLNDPTQTDAAPLCLSADPNSCLCPPDLSKGCIKPPFQMPTGNAITAGMPFDATFGGASYSYTARAFNDNALGETASVDLNGILVFRALGTVRGEQKLIEVTAKALSGLGLINCIQSTPGEVCPSVTGGATTLIHLDGRGPKFQATLPTLPPIADPLDPTACNPANYYCIPANFGLTACPITGGSTIDLTPVDNCYYFTDKNIQVQSTGTNQNIVIVSLGTVLIKGSVTLNNTVVIGKTQVQLQGSVTLRAPLPKPAIISEGTVKGDNGVLIVGNVYAASIDLNPITVDGILIGDDVSLKGGTTISDQGSLNFYAFMPGFTYPKDEKTVTVLPNGWREIQ